MNNYSKTDEPLPDEMIAPIYTIGGRTEVVCGNQHGGWYCIAEPHGLDPANHYYIWSDVRTNAH